jgi:hypothetical protein
MKKVLIQGLLFALVFGAVLAGVRSAAGVQLPQLAPNQDPSPWTARLRTLWGGAEGEPAIEAMEAYGYVRRTTQPTTYFSVARSTISGTLWGLVLPIARSYTEPYTATARLSDVQGEDGDTLHLSFGCYLDFPVEAAVWMSGTTRGVSCAEGCSLWANIEQVGEERCP